MNNGISIYPGLDNLLEENIVLIETAAKCGIKRLFTSFNIPETNRENFKRDLQIILNIAKNNDMEVISDISPKTCDLLGIDPKDLKGLRKLGITTIRLDDGYSEEETANLSKNGENIKIQLNASAVDEEFLKNLEKHRADFGNIDALHNFYPRKNTGLSEEFFTAKNNLLKKYNIKISAFISSAGKKRGPMFEGLPTLEFHRDTDTFLSMRHLAALGVDGVFISESLPLKEELEHLSTLKENKVILKTKLLTDNEELKKLLKNAFTARADEARDVIRAKEGRLLIKSEIPPENNIERKKGCITLDNALYKRYNGELQIIKRDLPSDERVNVVAKVSENELFMLKYILPKTSFSFAFE
ncbi:MAG: DUF871 domain-containing protein [Selenomonadaceae bacterium]|nr:DUF871 domain-containing protein [Selenomonadaceae bacterium]MBP3723149.1 DUF871 domain-containing protein [Selenomonadaceae bacterium]